MSATVKEKTLGNDAHLVSGSPLSSPINDVYVATNGLRISWSRGHRGWRIFCRIGWRRIIWRRILCLRGILLCRCCRQRDCVGWSWDGIARAIFIGEILCEMPVVVFCFLAQSDGLIASFALILIHLVCAVNFE